MQLSVDNPTGVQARLQSLGWMTADEKLISLESAGAGNMNCTLRARLGDRSLILKQSLPCVARYPQIAAPVERMDVEAAFYAAVAGEPELASHMPTLLGYDPENHLLALQDLGPAGDCSSHYGDTGQDPLPTRALLHWLGSLHALPPQSLKDRSLFENHAMRALNHQHIFEIPLTPDNGLTLPEALIRTARQFAADKPLKARANALGDIYLAPSSSSSTARLLHGDYYPGSWLRVDGSLFVIDVEFAFLGATEFDLGVFLAHCVMTGTQPDELTPLLEDYPAAATFDTALALEFAAMEIIRRLLGVAQLPLTASAQAKLSWLDWSREQLTK